MGDSIFCKNTPRFPNLNTNFLPLHSIAPLLPAALVTISKLREHSWSELTAENMSGVLPQICVLIGNIMKQCQFIVFPAYCLISLKCNIITSIFFLISFLSLHVTQIRSSFLRSISLFLYC